jgi:hypothetical protein
MGFYVNKKQQSLHRNVLFVVVIIGIVLRFFVMRRGYNFDFESYKIVGEIMSKEGNVYAETARYNYGPIWFSILGVFHAIAALFSHSEIVFRALIVGLLTLADASIAYMLYKKYGLKSCVIFFLNPVSIIITGYHNQFDNLAILIALLSLSMAPKPGFKHITRRHVYSALLLGLSLMTKHIFFVFPLWFFIREKSFKVKLFMSAIPVLIFASGFLPFLGAGKEGIINNVFLYKSFANAPLLNALVSPSILNVVNPLVLLLGVLVVVGFMTRKLRTVDAGLWYLLTLVAFSPAIANQYLAIAMPAAAAFGALFFAPFIIFATLLVSVTSSDGLHVASLSHLIPARLLPYISPDGAQGQYKLIIATLFLGMIFLAVYLYRTNWYKSLWTSTVDAASEQLTSLRQLFK